MKKIFKFSSFLLGIVLLFSSFPVTVFAEGETTEEPTILLGDMDSNGKLETTDARSLLRLCAAIEPISEDDVLSGDMNSDGMLSIEDVFLLLRAVSNIGGTVIPDKNGENFLTDDPNNEFIRLISETYDLDPASLVAVYSVPDSGTNYVLRFKKSLLGNQYEKRVDNLWYVYHIGVAPERKISYTNGQLFMGDHYNCQAAEGVLVFNIVKTTVMGQYPDYFEDV